MKFIETELQGSFIIELEKIEDERGFFGRVWDSEIFKEKGLASEIKQCSISGNIKKGSTRGMHFQIPPFEEEKIIRCLRGKLFDVIIDLRKNSNTYKRWVGIELSQDNQKMIYVPKGFAHGFQTLEDNTVLFYQMSQNYSATHERGVRWDDPVFSIKWPLEPTIISERDNSFPKL